MSSWKTQTLNAGQLNVTVITDPIAKNPNFSKYPTGWNGKYAAVVAGSEGQPV
jgi:hypothetical protein